MDIDGDGYIISKATNIVQQTPEFINSNNYNSFNVFQTDDGLLLSTEHVNTPLMQAALVVR